MTIRRLFLALIVLGTVGSGCRRGARGDGEDGGAPLCSDRACFSQCRQTQWVGLESFYVLSARCVDDAQCICEARCDDVLCDTYCRDELGLESGICTWLSCECAGALGLSSDAGDLDGGDPETGDAGR